MNDVVINPALVDHRVEPAAAFALWYKPDRPRAGWELVATAPTYSACVDRIGCGGRRNGSWLALPAGRRP
ncbi:MAG: hypothetical protein C0501_17480 [Isosphaera sp.]|nr:hypothetical protein [Isosphaera sp.]